MFLNFCGNPVNYAPAIYNGGGHIASPLSVRPSVHTYVPYVLSRTYKKWFPGDIFWKHWCIGFIFHTQVHNHKIQVKFDYGQNPPIIIRVMALDLRMKNGFRGISFENSYVLDSYFIHRYIIIKYRSSSITGKIHQLSSELWPLIWVRKMVSGRFFWIHWWNGFIFHTQVYNHKIQVKFDYGQNQPIIIRVMALDLRMKNGFRAISFEYVGVLDSYFIHRYVIIKYRPSSITDKIHQLFLELWPFVNDNALFMRIWQ